MSAIYKHSLFRGIVLLLSLLTVNRMHAQQATCEDWIGVQSWSGTINVSVSGAGSDQYGTTYNVNESATFNFNGATPSSYFGFASNCPLFPGAHDYWIASGSQVNSSITIHDQINDQSTACTQQNIDADNSPISVDQLGVAIGMDSQQGYSLRFPNDATVDTGVITGCGVPPVNFVVWGPLFMTYANFLPGSIPLPSTFGALTGTASFQAYDYSVGGFGTALVTWTINWNFVPMRPDLDLLISIPNYSTWRPTAGRVEKDIGLDSSGAINNLEIQALLVNKATQQPVNFAPDKVTFQLVDVSHVPGVAMNWPASDLATADPDLTFEPSQQPGCNTVIETCTFDDPVTVEVVMPTLPATAEPVRLFLSPHDWGGWGTLHVTAEVSGLSPIVGHMLTVSDPNNPDILIPQRQPSSVIADSWKNTHHIPLGTSDLDDSETNPVGDSHAGDGLTLWEEYRGFYMGCSGNQQAPGPEGTKGCQHAEGDPTTKDLFVAVTDVPADEGIALFQFGSGLNVHFHRLTTDEMGPNNGSLYRVINFNHSGGPHVADEHALVMQMGPATGKCITVPNFVNTSGRQGLLPREVDHIEIDLTLKGQDSTNDNYAGCIAHELAHAVGAYHHGDIDSFKEWWLDPSTNNIIEADTGTFILSRTIYVKWEDDDPTVAKTTVPLNFLSLPPLQLGSLGFPKIGTGRRVYVGNNLCVSSGGNTVVMNGQHSGDVIDFMRYDNAQVYIPAGFPFIRFLATGEPEGADLTDHPGGTGVNAPNRKPRPRYGDAYPGKGGTDSRGNDRSSVDVNDNLSNQAIVRSLQTVCPQ